MIDKSGPPMENEKPFIKEWYVDKKDMETKIVKPENMAKLRPM